MKTADGGRQTAMVEQAWRVVDGGEGGNTHSGRAGASNDLSLWHRGGAFGPRRGRQRCRGAVQMAPGRVRWRTGRRCGQKAGAL